MVSRISTSDTDFEEKFIGLLNARQDTSVDVHDVVQKIIAGVKAKGDEAVVDYTNTFDRVNYTTADLVISSDEIEQQAASVSPEITKALQHAAARIRAFHQKQLPETIDYTDNDGVRLGQRWGAIDAVGLYVPGGKANYPSSVLMNAMPAHVAGARRIVMCVPTPDGILNPVVLAAAKIAGVTEIYKIGGAQAIAAMSFGTDTIKPVDKIVGPGNAYVAEAKRQVFGKVGIDTIAGPSEILVLADKDNNPDWIAADLLSQAEHDEIAQSILITDNADFADRVELAIAKHLDDLERTDIAIKSWGNFGCIILVEALSDACALIDRIAPEHLELALEDANDYMKTISNAGAIFLGRHTPEAIGDYIAGPNHVLPTGRTARFSGGLSVYDFLKRTTFVECDADSIKTIGPDAVILANEERLGAHALSVQLRLGTDHD